jgi:transposase
MSRTPPGCASSLRAGLLKASFVPPKPIRALRNLTRYRKTQIQERSREANRLHKALEDTGIKLDCVATDILGKSGRAMLDALVAGTTDPEILANLAKGKPAEIGIDMSVFPTARHLASWAAMCPGNDQSAGKRRSGKTRKGSEWLDWALEDAAMAAIRTKDSYLAAQYARLEPRRGHKKALGAIKH